MGVWCCCREEACDLESCLLSGGEGMLWERPEFGFGEACGTEEGEGFVEWLIEEVDDWEGLVDLWEVGWGDGVWECGLEGA